MADASLNIKIGADVQNALTGLKQVEAASTSLKKATGDTQERFVVLNNTLNQSVGYARQQANALNNLANSERAVGSSAAVAEAGIAGVGATSLAIVPAVNAAYSAVRRLAFILPGIGIAGIFNLAFEGLASAFGSESKAVDDASEAIKEHQKLVDGVIGKTKEESATVDILVGKIQSGTLSREQTVQAIKELQKIAPDYFSKLNAEKASIEDVTKAYGAYNNQIIKTIEAQIRIAEITDLVKQRLTQSAQTPEAAKFIADLQAQGKTLEEINAIVVKGIGEDVRAQAQLLQGNKFVTDEQLKQALLTAKIPAGVQTILSLLQKERDILKDINDVSDLVEIGPVKEKVEKDPKIKFNSIKFGLDLDTSNFQKDINELPNKLDKNAFLKIGGELMESLGVGMSDELRKLIKDLNKILASGIGNGLANFGEAIGNAIATGKNPIEAAGKSILSTLGDLMENIGKSLIEYGIVKEGLDTILEGGIAIPGVVALAAGAAAIALGALVKGLAQPKKFAEGGIITGPTYGLVGEAGPEVVFPLSQLNRFVKNNTGNSISTVRVEGQISGNTLKLLNARTNKNQGLV